MKDAQLMVPIYTGSHEGKKKEGDKKEKTQYDEEMKKMLRQLGLEPEEDEEDRFLLGGNTYLRPSMPETGFAPMPVYNTPSSMGRMPMYNPAQLMARPRQMPYLGDGKTSMININYTAPDGTTYQMGVMAPQENRGKALYNVLAGLYGLMMAEGKSGQLAKGKSPGRYAGGKGGS